MVARGVQDLLICTEMLMAAVAFTFTFPITGTTLVHVHGMEGGAPGVDWTAVVDLSVLCVQTLCPRGRRTASRRTCIRGTITRTPTTSCPCCRPWGVGHRRPCRSGRRSGPAVSPWTCARTSGSPPTSASATSHVAAGRAAASSAVARAAKARWGVGIRHAPARGAQASRGNCPGSRW